MSEKIRAILGGLTEAGQAMLLASGPDDVTGEEGCGVELRTSQQYATARALERRELGFVTGPGSPFCGMYWSNATGLAVRAHLQSLDKGIET